MPTAYGVVMTRTSNMARVSCLELFAVVSAIAAPTVRKLFQMKLSTRLSIIAIVAASLGSTTASAVQPNPWMLRFAVESGGDTLIGVRFENGDEEKIKGGGLLHFEGGKRFNLFADKPELETEFTVGYKMDSVNADNGDLKFTRFTLNAMQYYRYNEKVRFGLGATFHMNPTLEVDILGVDGEVELDDTLGFMLGADYAYSEQVNFGARATMIDYEVDNSEDASGNSFGAYISVYF